MKNKLQQAILIVVFALFSRINISNAQCSIVSGNSGVVHDIGNTVNINYTCAVSGAAVMANLGAFTGCGITFPAINAPWSNNSNTLGTATYTFSTPIYAIKIIIAYVGVNGQINPESFTITTNGSIPMLTVDAGTCAAWTIAGNVITSPSVVGGINSYVTVTSASPFTTLSILSGTNSSSTGGSSYGLCDASIFTSVHEMAANPLDLVIYPNPNQGKFKIDLNNNSASQLHLEIYSCHGAKIVEQIIYSHLTTTELDLTNFPKGIYFVKLFNDERNYTRKIVIE